MSNTNFEGALSWDSEVSVESSFVLLEPGDYEFKVEKMERGNYQPSDKSSIQEVSPQAELTITVFGGDQGNTNVKEFLILHTKTEWKLSEFLTAVGQKKPGQPTTPNWQLVPGATGRCEIEVNQYTDRQGKERENNRIVRFLPPTESTTESKNEGFAF